MVNVAYLGTRGIPPSYGGLESATYNLIRYMAQRNVGAYVACESSCKHISIPYVRQIFFPVSKNFRLFSEVFYDFVFLLLFAFKSDTKYVYLLAYPAGIFCFIPRLFGKIVAVNVNGLEWKRRKFPKLVQMLLHVNERMVHKAANIVVFDSYAIKKYHEEHYHHSGVYLPYMVELNNEDDVSRIAKWNLKPDSYYLVVARLEPENNIFEIVRGHGLSTSEKTLVICGSFTNRKYAEKVISKLREFGNFVYAGFVSGRDQLALRKFCYAYIHGHEVGGTNPSLLEAIASGNAVIAKDVPYNREVIQDGAEYFNEIPNITRTIYYLENTPGGIDKLRLNAQKRYADFEPQKVIEEHLRVFN